MNSLLNQTGKILDEYDFKKIGVFIILVFILGSSILGIVTGIYYYNKYNHAKTNLVELGSGTSPDSETNILVSKVSKLIRLPQGENPVIATVTEKLLEQKQPFLKNAKAGDKVLLYMQAKQAFLYDPVNTKIVEAGPLFIPSPVVSAITPSSIPEVAGFYTALSPAPSVLSLAIQNGTATESVIHNFEREINKKIKNIKIIQKANAVKRDHTQSILINLKGYKDSRIDTIAKEMNLLVSALPAEESAPKNVDILIIVGSDRN